MGARQVGTIFAKAYRDGYADGVKESAGTCRIAPRHHRCLPTWPAPLVRRLGALNAGANGRRQRRYGQPPRERPVIGPYLTVMIPNCRACSLRWRTGGSVRSREGSGRRGTGRFAAEIVRPWHTGTLDQLSVTFCELSAISAKIWNSKMVCRNVRLGEERSRTGTFTNLSGQPHQMFLSRNLSRLPASLARNCSRAGTLVLSSPA
jgi:hypothetical protein